MIKGTVLLLLASFYLTFPILGKSNCITLKPTDFQKEINGKQVGLYFPKNGQLAAAITNYGARIVSLCVPSKNADVVVGFKSIDDYLKARGMYHGAIICRVTGRIANRTFDLNGRHYSLNLITSPAKSFSQTKQCLITYYCPKQKVCNFFFVPNEKRLKSG